MKLFNRSTNSADVGAQMEELAARYLQRAGLRIEARNYHCRQGEIDLVARDGDTLVFVEVRFRKDSRFGGAGATVDARKQGKLLASADRYLQEHRLDCPCRFDVIAIDGSADNINWITNAFGA